MCRNSFGPCALLPGPSTPVMQNCARGNFSPSMYMNGIVPPSPMNIDGLPKCRCDAASSDFSSHGDISGASHPALAVDPVTVTFAPYGGSFDSAAITASCALS